MSDDEGYHPLDLVVAQKKRIAELEAENKKLRELVRDLIDNDPNDPISDAGHIVLDLWRHQAREALGMK